MVTRIDRTLLQDMIARNENLVLIDVLPETAYVRGHIPGAINIPSEEILARAPTLLTDLDAEIIVYCKNGPCKRSQRAAQRLETLGFTRVYDYHLGRDDWSSSGLALHSAERR